MATLVQRGTILAVTTIGAALLALGACVPRDEENEIANLDNQIVNTVDPAVNRAIQDEIAVDPELSNNSNRNAVRTPGSPDTGSYPAEDAPGAGGAGGAGGGASGSARLADAGVGCAQGARAGVRAEAPASPMRASAAPKGSTAIRSGRRGSRPPSPSIRAAG